jgi:hypothetical protein
MPPKVRIHGGIDLLGDVPASGLEIKTDLSLPASTPKGTLIQDSNGRLNIATKFNSPPADVLPIAFLKDIPAAIDGEDGSSLLSGQVDPIAAQGTIKDSFVNLVSGDFFSKSTGAWVKTGNIKGPKGDQADDIGGLLFSIFGQLGVVSGTTLITSKNTAPTITEGTEIWRYTYTAKELNSLLEIMFTGVCDATRRNGKVFFVLFRDNNVVDWGSYSTNAANSGSPGPILLRHIHRNTDLNAHTYVLRVGLDAAGTWYIGRGNDRTMGDINEAYFTFKETRQ